MPTINADAKIYQTGFSGLTFTDIQTFLKRTFSTAEQTLATSLIKQKEYELCNLTNRQFLYTGVEYYEKFNAPLVTVFPYATPLSTLVKIEVDGIDKTSLYVLGRDYYVYDNFFHFESPIVSAGNQHQAVKLTYTLKQFWGEDIKYLITRWVAVDFLASENGGVALSNMSFSGLSQGFDLATFNDDKHKIIFRYTDFAI